jgi:GT2 family glycosyltransferase
MNNGERTWIVLLNWRNGPDTIDCLNSILSCANQEGTGIVICDNNSCDESIHLIQDWAGRRHVNLVEYYWRDEIFRPAANMANQPPAAEHIPIALLHTGANLGFAGGNNVGIRYIQRHFAFDFILLLNNDTILTAGAVTAMARRFEQRDNIGMCGCTVVYHHTPTRVQAFGGAHFQPWLGRSSHIGANADITSNREVTAVEKRLDYILGAALMISRQCLEAIGQMEEMYFLYYEEVDWATRARRAGFSLAYAPQAVIFHKEGATIGSNSDGGQRSLLSEYYLVRSRIMFTRKFYPHFLPSVIAFTLAQGARALLNFDFRRFAVRLRAIFGMTP